MRKLFYTYLAGPIEADSDDGGQAWRDKITPDLDKAGIYVQDPCKTEPLATGMDVVTAQGKFNGWIQSGNYELFAEKFRFVVDKDLRMVHRSDFIVVHLFPDIPTVGTIHEMAEAWRLKKPIYLVWYGAKSKVSKWALWLTTSSGGRLFDNLKQLTDYITIRYDKTHLSLREQILQFVRSIIRLRDERIYNARLAKIRKDTSTEEIKEEKKKCGEEPNVEENKVKESKIEEKGEKK